MKTVFYKLLLPVIFLILISTLLVRCSTPKSTLNKSQLVELPGKAGDSLLIKSPKKQAIPDSGYSKGFIANGEGLVSSIMRMPGAKMEHALQITNVLMEYLDFRALRPDQEFWLQLNSDSSNVEKFIFFENRVKYFILEKDSTGGLSCSEKKMPTAIRHRIVEGELKTSLDAALAELNLKASLRQTVNNILECTVSFQSDARKGDIFRLLVEEEFYEDSIFISGKVLYAAYLGDKTGLHEGFYYEESDPKSAFNSHYTRDGRALVNSGLRIPVDRVHVTSAFGYRIHPITGVNTMHNGVDYAASTGSPVYSACAGKVKSVSYSGAGGKQIVVGHADGTETFYLHLSRFNVKQGQSVKSRQVIGAVGSTGRSTGPHLHFGIRQKNKWLNPLSRHMIATPKLDGDKYAALQKCIINIEKLRSRNLLVSIGQNSIAYVVGNGWLKQNPVALLIQPNHLAF